MTSRRIRLEIEQLGARILPSATVLTAPFAAEAVIAGPQIAHLAEHHALTGQGHGNYSVAPVQCGAGIDYHLQGSAYFGGLNGFAVTGSVHAVGFIQQGQAGGLLTFTNSRGSITMTLEGPQQPGFSPLPQQFHYSVVGGTGAFANLKDSGTLTLNLGTSLFNRFTLRTQSATADMTSGIRGSVLEGPVSPVEHLGVPNTRPVPDALISIQTADGALELARLKSDKNGMFQISLDPGVYRIIVLPADPSQPLPLGTPQEVHVVQDQVLNLKIVLDSGIR